MASTTRKSSGEAKLLLILGLIVLTGVGALWGLNRGAQTIGVVPSPQPTETPRPRTAADFDQLMKNARHVKGDANAPIQIVEFADFQCPSCRRAFNTYVRDLVKKHPVRMAFYHLPLEMHARAVPAALAAEAAAKQNKFWPMYDALFTGDELNPDLSDEALQLAAKNVGLNMEQFQRDMADTALAEILKKDEQTAIDVHVNSTPTFFIRDQKGNVTEVQGGQSGKEFLDKLFEEPVQTGASPAETILQAEPGGAPAPSTAQAGVANGTAAPAAQTKP
jgi:protein-disulfide isomerase